MNDAERWTAALVLALAVHFFILQPSWLRLERPGSTGQMVLVHLSANQVRVGENPGVNILDAHSSNDEANLADQRRKIYNRYLDEISDAIHARRFEYGRRDLIGVAEFGFIIEPSGMFSNIELLGGSGHPDLDRAAEHAVQAASGVVKRPLELGSENIAVLMPIKYQYDLH